MAHRPRRLRCFVCDHPIENPRNSVYIYGQEREAKRNIAIDRRGGFGLPDENVQEDTRICSNCNIDITREINIAQRNPMAVRLNVLRQSRNNSCFICNEEDDVQRLSIESKVEVYNQCDIFLPQDVRSCNHHLDDRGYVLRPLLPGLRCINKLCVINGPYLSSFLRGTRKVSKEKSRIRDVNDLTDEEMYCLTSLTKVQFIELFDYCDPVERPGGHDYVKRKDLLMFLCKMRQGASDEFLKSVFDYSTRQNVSYTVQKVRQSLMLRFVPENVGLNAITRDQYIRQHVTPFANALYNPQPNIPVAIAYIDCTYTFCHKSNNFRVLRQTFCYHKGRHLVKPALMVAPDGYILDVHGTYFSDARNNDAAILENEMFVDENLINWFQDNDIIIVDRGYRDVVPLLEEFGLTCRMPPLREAGQNQLTTEDANEARIVTKTRWMVEARNGHIKTKFKLLNNVQHVQNLPNIGDYYRIAAAIINRFHGLIYMEGANVDMAENMLARAEEINHVQIRVENENLARRNGNRWVRLDANNVLHFPLLTIDYLKQITVGIYQIKLAASYVQDKLQRDDDEQLQVELLNDQNRLPEEGLMRVRMYSRHRNNTRYQLWIHYVPNGNVNNRPIRGYYCTCIAGARTLGTCAHITSVLWYMGYARHEENVHYPSDRLLNEIEDAGNRPPQENPV